MEYYLVGWRLMANLFYCCIDGGGSKTQIALFDGHGRRLGTTITGPTSLSINHIKPWDIIYKSLKDLYATLGIELNQFSSTDLVIGVAGANNERLRNQFYRESPFDIRSIKIVTDAYIAALGAHGGSAGSIIIVGTGTIGYTIDKTGQKSMYGGWGFPVGDQGGGAWIGMRALSFSLKAHEGHLGNLDSALYRQLIKKCGYSRNGILEWLNDAGPTEFASLAPIVIDCANKGDDFAINLLIEAGFEIEALASVMQEANKMPLSLVGGLAEPLTPYLPQSLRTRIKKPVGDPIDGALFIAQGKAPHETSDWN